MIITCPECEKKYRLGAQSIVFEPIPGSSQVGIYFACSQCHHQWWQSPDIALVEPESTPISKKDQQQTPITYDDVVNQEAVFGDLVIEEEEDCLMATVEFQSKTDLTALKRMSSQQPMISPPVVNNGDEHQPDTTSLPSLPQSRTHRHDAHFGVFPASFDPLKMDPSPSINMVSSYVASSLIRESAYIHRLQPSQPDYIDTDRRHSRSNDTIAPTPCQKNGIRLVVALIGVSFILLTIGIGCFLLRDRINTYFYGQLTSSPIPTANTATKSKTSPLSVSQEVDEDSPPLPSSSPTKGQSSVASKHRPTPSAPAKECLVEDFRYITEIIDDKTQVLTMSGKIYNPNKIAVPVPNLSFNVSALCRSDEKPDPSTGLCHVKKWHHKWQQKEIPPMEKIGFYTVSDLEKRDQVEKVEVTIK